MNLPNNKTFLITIKKSKTYEILLSGFSKTSLWFITIVSRLNLDIVVSLMKSLSATVESVLDVNLSIPKLIKKTFSTSSLVNDINVVPKGIYKILSVTSSLFSSSLVTRLIKKSSVMTESLVGFTLSILVATFNLLSQYDPDALSVMDTETLGSLDYTIA